MTSIQMSSQHIPMFNTPPRGHRPPRPRRAPVVSNDSFDNASGIFSTSGTISECTMASFLLESNSRTDTKTSRMESPRQQHIMSPSTAELLRRKQEDARVAILSLNRFIFQAGNLYRGKRLNREEENILRESAHQVGLSFNIVDALLEHTSDPDAVVQYCMESEDSFAKKLRKDRRLSQLLQKDASEPEGNFNLKSSIWRILMHKIVQQTLRDHGMDIGDVLNKSSLTPHVHADSAHFDEYAMNSADIERYGRDYTEERKQLILPEDEVRDARRNAIAQIEFHQSRGPMDSLRHMVDVPFMIGEGPAAEYRDGEMSLLNVRASQQEETVLQAQRQRSSPLTPRSLNVQLQRNKSQRTPPPGSAYNGFVDPALEQSDFDENDFHDTENENRPPRSSSINPHTPLSAVKRALAMFESPGNFDQDHPQKEKKSPTNVRRGSSSKIAERLALFEKGVQDNNDPIDYQQLERVRSSEHQALHATSLFDVFSTPQKQDKVAQDPQRAASTSKISKVKRSQIAPFENRGFENKPEANTRVMRSEAKKLDPSRRILFDESHDREVEVHQSGSSGNKNSQSIMRGSPVKRVTFCESQSAKPIHQQESFINPQKNAMDKMLQRARKPPKPPTPSKQSQRSLKMREHFLKNMSTTNNDEHHHQDVSNRPVPSDDISISSHHSMEESLDPACVQDYGPQREVKRTPRPKRNIREENFLEDERVRVEPPEQMFYFESIDEITKNMIEEDSLMEHAMNAGAHRANATDGEFQDYAVDEDDISEEHEYPYVSEMASSHVASNQMPTDSMISSISSGEVIQAPGSQSTFTDDTNRSWVEFHQVFDSIYGARSEVSQVESDLNSSKRRMENMFDTLHQVKQEAISMELRKPEREAKETEKPVENYHPRTPRAPKVHRNDFFDDVRLSGLKASFQVTHDDNSEFAANDFTMPHDSEQRMNVSSNTQLLNGSQTDPEEWAYFQNSHFHPDASYQDRSAPGDEEGVVEHFSDITDSQDMAKSEDYNDSTQSVVKVAYRDNDVNMATSSITVSNDESDVDFMNPYESKDAKHKGLSFSNVQEKAKKMARDHLGMNDLPSQPVEDKDPRTPRKSSPRYPRSPVFDKAMKKLGKGTVKNIEEKMEQDLPSAEQEKEQKKQYKSSPRQPAFKTAIKKVRKYSLKTSHDNVEKDQPQAGLKVEQNKQQKSSLEYPRSPAYEKAMQKARKHTAKDYLESEEVEGLEADNQVQQLSSPRYPRSPAYSRAMKARKAKAIDNEPILQIPSEDVSSLSVDEENSKVTAQPSIDIQDLPPPPSLEEAFNLSTENAQDDAFHQAQTPRTSHSKSKFTSRLSSIQMERSLRIDTSRSDEENVRLNGVPAIGESLTDKAHNGQGSSQSAHRSYSKANEDVRSAAQASGVPQQVLDIILQQAADHEKELEEAATEKNSRSWDAIAKKTNKKQRAAESPIAISTNTEALYSLPKQKKTKPIKMDVSLIPDEIPEGVSKEDVKLLERFIQLSNSNFEGKHLSADSENRVRTAASNVGLAEDIIDQLLEQARWKREQKATPENDTLHQPQENNNNTYHQYHSDFSTVHMHVEDGHSTRHKFPSASPVKPAVYPESPGYTVPRDERWSSRRRRSENYRRHNACDDPCRILGNIKDNLLYWANCQGGGSFDEDEYTLTGSDLDQF